MKISLATTLIVFVIFNWACDQAVQSDKIRNVNADEFQKLLEINPGQLIDVRTPGEFEMGHIAGAKMVNFYSSGYKEKLNQLDRNQTIYIYCRSGNRTAKTANILIELGFTDIVNLEHGLVDWQRNKYELTREEF